MTDPEAKLTSITPAFPKTQVFLGVSIQLGTEIFYLEPKKAISDAQKYGMEIGLPEGKTIDLGTVGEGIDSILDTISPGTKLPSQDKVPPQLQSAFKTLTSANISITDFHVKVPGSETKTSDGSLETHAYYTVGLSATWDGDHGHLFGNVSIKGIFVKVSNEEVAIDPVAKSTNT